MSSGRQNRRGSSGTQLLSTLNHHIDTLIITGMATGGCVRTTVIDAFSYNYNAIIPLECVADSRPAGHGLSLYDMDTMYVDVRTLSEVVEELNRVKGS